MARTSHSRQPTYRKHKPSGQAVVTLYGKDHYLGHYGTKASKERYDCLIAEYLRNGRTMPRDQGLTVNEIILAYLHHAQEYYVNAAGATEVDNIKSACKVLRQVCGTALATQFGPVKLVAVRDGMLARGWCRTNVNHMVDRIKRMFKWGNVTRVDPWQHLRSPAIRDWPEEGHGRCS
jgi:hypothetical protein